MPFFSSVMLFFSSVVVPLWHWKTGGTLNASRSKGTFLFSTWKTFYTPSEEKEDYSACYALHSRTNSSSSFISSISWIFLNDAMAISAKLLLKNHTDKERFAAVSSCNGNLNFTFPVQMTVF